MACKIVFFFNQGAQGWTETYYTQDATPAGFFSRISSNLWAKAIQCRAPGTQLFAARASVVESPGRLSSTFFFGDSYLKPNPNSLLGAADVTGTDALLTLYDAIGNPRKLYLRGLDDNDTLRSANFNSYLDAMLGSQIEAYFKALKAAQMCIRIGKRPPAVGYSFFPVASVAPVFGAPNASSVKCVGVNPAWPAGTGILFVGSDKNDLPGFPRILYIDGPPVTSDGGVSFTFVANYRFRCNTDPYMPIGMKALLEGYDYNLLSTYSFESFTAHKVGRAFGVPRGRARAAVTAR